MSDRARIRGLQEELNEFIAAFNFPEIETRRRIKMLVRDYGDLKDVLTDSSGVDVACYAIDMVLNTLLEEYNEIDAYKGNNTNQEINIEKALLVGTLRWAIEHEKLEGMRPAVKSRFQTQLAPLKEALVDHDMTLPNNELAQTPSTSEKEPMSNLDTKMASSSTAETSLSASLEPATSSVLQKRELSKYKENLNKTDAADAERDELDRKGRPMEKPTEAATAFLDYATSEGSCPMDMD